MTIFNYVVNYVDVIIVGIIFLFVIIGFCRGLFITLINLVRSVIGFSLCMIASNRLAQPIYDSYISDKIVSTLTDKVVNSANLDEIIANLNNFVSSLPSFIKGSINLNNVSISSSGDVAKSLADSIFQPIALFLLKIAIFVLCFILFFGITGLIILIIRKKNKKSKGKKPLKTVDRIFGGVFGIVKGAVVVFVLVTILSFFMGVDSLRNEPFFVEASNSILYKTILNFNPFNVVLEGIL